MIHALLFIGSYVLGSMPFGVWIARAHGVDIFSVGSGNPGATNVQRAVGKKAGLAVFFLDVFKGFLPALIGGIIFQSAEMAGVAGLCAVFGHCASPFLGFRGGKGISTGLGALLAATPLVGIATFITFALCLGLTRYVSLSSIICAVMLTVYGLVFRIPTSLVIAFALFALFLIYRHRSNIQRLLNGTEPKFSWKKDEKDKIDEPEPQFTADLEENP